VIARTRARLTIKIRSEINLYPHRHFTEYLVDAFGKSPQKIDLNYKTSSFLIRQLKNTHQLPPATVPNQMINSTTQIHSFDRRSIMNSEQPELEEKN
jgi:hypothetical protein